MKSFLTLLALSITIVASAQKRDSVRFESMEDTLHYRGYPKMIRVTHIDYKCTWYKSGIDTTTWIFNGGQEWHRFDKWFALTDTGWKKL